MNRTVVGPLFFVSLILGAMIGLEFHVSRTSSAELYQSYFATAVALRADLKETAALQRGLSTAAGQLKALRLASNRHVAGLTYLQRELSALERSAGLTPQTGPGVAIRIAYDPQLPIIPGLRYVDEATQLQIVVNLLDAGGARAIALSGQRLVTTSSIRSVGGLTSSLGPFAGTVQVNGIPVAAPYVFRVIGSPGAIRNILTVEGIGQQFAILDQSFRVTTYTGARSVSVPAYTGPMPGQYAREAEN